MESIRSVSGGFLRFLILATFAWAAGTDAYGAQACAHHDTVPGPEGHESHVPAAFAEAHAATSPSGTHPHSDHESEGPCTCVTHCQAPGSDLPLGSRATASAGEPHVPAAFDRPLVPVAVLGPRHQLFELHLPNAPPHST